jgi:hypothetical protein
MTVTVFEHKKSDLLIVPVNPISENVKKGITNIKKYKGHLYVPKATKKFFLELLKAKCEEESQTELYIISKL